MTVYEEFEKTVEKYGDRPFLHIPMQATRAYSNSPVDLTYREAFEKIQVLRRQYHEAGYGLNQRVAIMLDNREEFFLHFLALNSLGIGIVPVNSGFFPKEMEYIITHSDACLVLVLPEHLEKVKAALKDSGNNVPLVTTATIDSLPESLSKSAEREPDAHTEVAMLYTSGTTGKPKGCMLSTEYFICMGQWYVNLGGLCELEHGKERLLTPLPLVHMNALCSMMGMMMSGGCNIQLDRFHASTWWETVRESGATIVHYLGVMPAILLNQPEVPEDDFSGQIKFGFGAGSDPRHQEKFEKRFGFPLIEGWAMTESGTEVSVIANKEPRYLGKRCIGKPFAEIEYRLIDEEGNDVPEGEPGELLIRIKGDNPRKGFFTAYYKDPEATEKAWEGGYFHTGDVVRVDEEGYFYFVDRRKNIVRRSGENIAAVEVEGVVFQHPAVANCVVAPVPDEIRGEEVAVCIILNEGFPATEDTAREIFTFSNDKLIYYKVPGYFMFVDNLPMTASQKIQRGEVKKLCNELLGKDQCIDLRELKRKRK